MLFSTFHNHMYEFFFIILETKKTAALSFFFRKVHNCCTHSLANRSKSIKIVPKYFFNSLFCAICVHHTLCAVWVELRRATSENCLHVFHLFAIVLLSVSLSFLRPLTLTRSSSSLEDYGGNLIYCVGKNICGHNKPSIIREEHKKS